MLKSCGHLCGSGRRPQPQGRRRSPDLGCYGYSDLGSIRSSGTCFAPDLIAAADWSISAFTSAGILAAKAGL